MGIEHDREGSQIAEFRDGEGRRWMARFRPSRGPEAGDPRDPRVLEFLPLDQGVRLGMVEEFDLHGASDAELADFLRQAREASLL